MVNQKNVLKDLSQVEEIHGREQEVLDKVMSWGTLDGVKQYMDNLYKPIKEIKDLKSQPMRG